MKKFIKYLLPVLGIFLIYFIAVNYPKLNIITGFAAKNACSCIFEAGRSLESVESGDNNFVPVSYAAIKVHDKTRSVTSNVFGLKKRTAVYTEGLGCILVPEEMEQEKIVIPEPERKRVPINLPYPYGQDNPKDCVFSSINYGKLDRAITNSFDSKEEQGKLTRAVVVLYKDHLVAEKYAPGFSEESKFLGWSMTKSITSAVLGVLEKQGKISLSQNNLFRAWEDDPRSKITINHLLHMSSGLEWEEDYSTISDVTKMLFLEKNMAEVQLKKPLLEEPGSMWNYSSGTSNLLSAFIRNQFPTHQDYLNFWYTGLIDKINMYSMTVEPDAAGNYVGSSYSWATARDWAKFGLLYLHRGNWNGEQILNESWVEYTVRPTEGSNKEYGAHFWLNAGGTYPNVPKDLFSSNGFQGQHVFIIPSRDLVVVRFGLAEHPDFNVDTFLSEILQAID